MNLDLGHKLLLRTCLGQCALHDDFGSTDSLILQVGELEAASETSLTQELALEVLLNADFAIIFDNFFFYDSLGTINAFFWM